ncbi:MAG TPA: serine/threonine protein phosphatase [Ruminococcus sp.]|nr:serine/threonine protein phosphatase [Ruminococcus sp.]
MWFGKKKKTENVPVTVAQTAGRFPSQMFATDIYSYELFEKVRRCVPLIDAAISKIVRLIGSFHVECDNRNAQKLIDSFFKNVPVGLTGNSIYSFIDTYLDSLLVYGNAVGEIVLDKKGSAVLGLWNGKITDVGVRAGDSPLQRQFFVRQNQEAVPLSHPERILFSALKPPDGEIYGVSLLQGLPAFAGILMKIYECVGQNFERAGNIRYAVTYLPSNDPSELAYANERAKLIADEWSKGMKASQHGEIRDFVSVGDVQIKVIGAEGSMPDTEIPVRQLLEQMLAKLSVPPFLLGLSWSSTERMSAQQADILTSELEYYRRILEPVISQIAEMFLRLAGYPEDIRIVWDNINLQDEVELAQARLYRAQAIEIEQRTGIFNG